jgi:hypothetical protein
MFNNISAAKESVREVLASLRIERVMSERGMSIEVQASTLRGVAASPSTARSRTSRVIIESITNHRDDTANAKLVPTILPIYIPPLSGEINRNVRPPLHNSQKPLLWNVMP